MFKKSILFLILFLTCPVVLAETETYLLASLGIVLKKQGDSWKIYQVIKASPHYRVNDILVKYADTWLAGLSEDEAGAMLNSKSGTKVSLKAEKEDGRTQQFQLVSKQWRKGKIELNINYSQGKLLLGPGNIEAERQGLRLDNEIINIANTDTAGLSLEDIKTLMSKGMAGEKCPVVIRRDFTMLRKPVTSMGETFGGIGVQISQSSRGILISQVVEQGAAKNAGINPEDIIVGVDGNTLVNKPFKDATELLRGKIGTPVTITIERTGYITYTAYGPEYEGLGFEIIKDKNGFMIVIKVIPDSPADKAGLKVGYKILSIEGRDLLAGSLNKAQLDDIFKPGDKEQELVIVRELKLIGEAPGFTVKNEGLLPVVDSITETGSADIAGLKIGDMLIKAGEKILFGESSASINKLVSERISSGIDITIRRKIKIQISSQWSL